MMLLTEMAAAQWQETFSDGNFTANPPWMGNTADWIVNGAGQLQSGSQVANSSFYLVTPSSQALDTEWEFVVRLGFNTSSANYADIFIIASAADLSAAGTTGYFVRVGNTQDEVSLYRKDATGSTRIIDGADGSTAGSDNLLRIKVVRAGNQFMLYRDATGTGNNYAAEGSATDNTYTGSAFFGVLVRQSTTAFFGRHFFDDIGVRPYVPDLLPPVLLSVLASSATALDLHFSEAVDAMSAQLSDNYFVDGGIGHPSVLQRDAGDAAMVHAVFPQPFPPGTTYTITVRNIRDLAGNALDHASASFDFYRPQPYDMLIDEIMADPSPPVGLPNTEYIELKNTSSHAIDLAGWRVSTETATSAPFPHYTLPPDSLLTIVGSGQVSAWTGYGNVLGLTGFPSLDNDGGLLKLISGEGATVHAVAYHSSWYDSPVKKAGGWSLEMIDTGNPCGGRSNWRASEDVRGGTPGRKNSVAALLPDSDPPQLLRAYVMDSLTIVAVFNEPLDSSAAAIPTHYQITGIAITGVRPLPPLFNTVALSVAQVLEPGAVHQLLIDGLTDCRGNMLEEGHVRVGRAELPRPSDLIINELLFDPPPGAPDFIELYNRSNKIIDVQGLYLANRNSSGGLNSPQRVTDTPFLLFPQDYLLVTTAADQLRLHYLVAGTVLEPPTLPSMPDDSGTIVLTDGAGLILDEVSYSAKWHFSLITNPQGVSLERIDPSAPAQAAGNWHSAASTAGYATPGYKNSQYRPQEDLRARIEISPQVFSPDNDGRDDVLTIAYTMETTGYIANITVFDENGRTIRRLVRNGLMGLKGKWTWDGLDEAHRQLPAGAYIIYTELFNLEGRRRQFRKAVFIARPGP